MKYKALIFIIFFVAAFLLDKITVAAYFPLIGKTIVVDVGHGAEDPGTVSGKTYEKDINLAIAKYLEDELSKAGATVILTRDGDYDLSSPNVAARKKSDFDNRIKLINNSNADMYVSIHLNYLSQKQYSGGQIFYNDKNKKNKIIAAAIQEAFNIELKSMREIKKIPSDLYMYERLDISGVLVECGFMSNYGELKKLKTAEYQRTIAKVIVSGIIKAL